MSSINQPIINCLWIRGCHDFSSAIIWIFYSIRNSHISFSHIRLRAWVGLQVDEHVARMLWLGMQSVVAISSNCPWMAMCLDSLDMFPYGTIIYIQYLCLYLRFVHHRHQKKLNFWNICHTWLMWVPCHTSRWPKVPFRVLPSYVFENHGGLRSLSPAE